MLQLLLTKFRNYFHKRRLPRVKFKNLRGEKTNSVPGANQGNFDYGVVAVVVVVVVLRLEGEGVN